MTRLAHGDHGLPKARGYHMGRAHATGIACGMRSRGVRREVPQRINWTLATCPTSA